MTRPDPLCTRLRDEFDAARAAVGEERALGIGAGLSWHHVADLVVFCVDIGMSRGMRGAWQFVMENGIPLKERRIGGEW